MTTVTFTANASTPAANLRDIAILNSDRDSVWTAPLAIKWARDLGCDVAVFETGDRYASVYTVNGEVKVRN